MTPCVLAEVYLFPIIMMTKAAGSSMASVNRKLSGVTYQWLSWESQISFGQTWPTTSAFLAMNLKQ